MKITVDMILTTLIIIIALIQIALIMNVKIPIERTIKDLSDKVWKSIQSDFFEYDLGKLERLQRSLKIVDNAILVLFALMFIIGLISLIYQNLI